MWNKTNEKLPDKDMLCLCKNKDGYKLLWYNKEYIVWDDEYNDDFYCQIGDIKEWISIEQVEVCIGGYE